ASAFEEGKALYVKGGLAVNFQGESQAQMFSIDLSIPWSTSSVPYKEITGASPDKLLSATLTKDSKKLVMFGETVSKEYDIKRGTWRDIPVVLSEFTDHRTWSRAMDPNTGKIYAIDGYNPYFESFRPLQVHEYDPSSGAAQTISMTPGFEHFFNDVQASWNPFTNKMMMFTKDNLQKRYQYFRTWDQINGWSETITKGTQPFDRNYGSITQAYNGAKLILFGGMIPGKYLDDIYIFDIATATWTQGTSAGAENARYGTVGAVTNDLFVSWGGRNRNGEVTSNIVLIYNLKTNVWQTSYTPSRSLEPTEPGTISVSPPPTGTITGSPSPTGTITVSPPPTGTIIVGPSPTGTITAIPSPTGSGIISPIENTATPSSTDVNTATPSLTTQSSPVAPSNESQTPTPSSGARPPSLGDGNTSEPLSNRNPGGNGGPGSGMPTPKTNLSGPAAGAAFGGLLAIAKYLNQDPFKPEYYSQEDFDCDTFSLQPVSISYSVRDIQPREQVSLTTSDSRGPQSIPHGWSSQYPIPELDTLRHPEYTSESWVADEYTIHINQLNDGSATFKKNVSKTQDSPSHEGSIPKHSPAISGVGRDPQHPRGYGDFESRNSQSEESSPSPINTAQSDPTASLTISDSSRNESYGGTTLIHDSIQHLDENNSKANDQNTTSNEHPDSLTVPSNPLSEPCESGTLSHH
ncbi:hypothetical protein BGW38_002393, partial [Lunasporangiospora selenospora]